MIDKRLFNALLLSLVCWITGGTLAIAQAPPRVVIDHEYEHKAAYLYHFAKLSTWAGKGNNEPTVIGVLGDATRFGNQLKRIEKQSERANPKISIVRFNGITEEEDFAGCHMLFISGRQGRESETARQRLAAVLERTNGRSTLIITENSEFARLGGAVNFYVENNRLRLLINSTAVSRAGVTIPQEITGLRSVTSRTQEELDR